MCSSDLQFEKENKEAVAKALSKPLSLEGNILITAEAPPMTAEQRRGAGEWERSREGVCRRMAAELPWEKSSNDLCGGLIHSRDDFLWGSASRGSTDLVPYCGRVGAIVASQKMGISLSATRTVDQATNISNCSQSAWEAACDSGLSGQFNADPHDVGYGRKAFAPDPWTCYCAVANACMSGPVLGLAKREKSNEPQDGGGREAPAGSH